MRYKLNYKGEWNGYKVYLDEPELSIEDLKSGESPCIGLPRYILEAKNKKVRDATDDEIFEIMDYLNSQEEN